MATVKVRQVGRTLVVTIPRAFRDACGIRKGQSILMEAQTSTKKRAWEISLRRGGK